MKTFGLLAMLMLLFSFARSNIEGQCKQETKPPYPVESNTMRGKVFRSDTDETISNTYILLESSPTSTFSTYRKVPAEFKHFDLRTDEKGNYCFTNIPIGKYTVSIHAWFPKISDIPCQKPLDAKTTDNGSFNFIWQWKSTAYMETVIFKDFSVESGHEMVKDFDLVCK